MAPRTLGYRIAQAVGWVGLAGILSIPVLLVVFDPPECLEPSADLVGTTSFEAPPCPFVDTDALYEATLNTTVGPIEVVLDPSVSPAAVNAFVFLAMHGWYDGTVFHRIVADDDHAYAQAGAANADGTGHAGFLVEHDPPSPILQYSTGVVAGIVSGDPLRLGSQFFIVGDDWEAIANPNTYPIYPPLGRIYDLPSLEIVRSLTALGTPEGEPATTVTIDSVGIVEILDDQRSRVVEPPD